MRLRSLCLLLIIVATLIILSGSGLADAVGQEILFRVNLRGHSDARIVGHSGARAVLSDGNAYLMTGSRRSMTEIRDAGVKCDSLMSGFRKEDWVLMSSEDPRAVSEYTSISLGAELAFVIGDRILLRKEEADRMVSRDRRLIALQLPDFEIPIKYAGVSPLNFVPVETGLLDSVAAMVSKDSLESYVRTLEGFGSRSTVSNLILPSRDWLVAKFRSFGCNAEIDSFPYAAVPYGGYAYNVVAEHSGMYEPETFIVVCAHYDSRGDDANQIAPGADDNASGTAMCLEIARVLNGLELSKTMRFICFAGEEQGLLGSNAYVSENRLLNIEVVLNADMIAFNSGTNKKIYVSSAANALAYARLIGGMESLYGPLDPVYGSDGGNSDHQSFIYAGFRAAYVHEFIFNTVNYHSTHDIADNCDFAYMTKVVRGCAAGTYAIAQAPPVVEGLKIVDLGKGDRLLIRWNAIHDPRDFDIVLRMGIYPGDSTFKYVIPKSDTSFMLTNLYDGVEYYVSAVVEMGESESIVRSEESAVAISIPETPSGVRAMPGYRSIVLTWNRSPQVDVVGYKIMRSVADMAQFGYVGRSDSGLFADSSINRENYYDYYVIAIDEDSIESAPTFVVTSRGAFFDHSLLTLLETGSGYIDSSICMPRFRHAVANIEHTEYVRPDQQYYLSKEELGQYRNIFWLSDGSTALYNNTEVLDWLIHWGVNVLIAGPETSIPVSQYASDWFGLYSNGNVQDTLFSGARGVDGWPDAALDTSVKTQFNMQGLSANLQFVRVFGHDPLISSGIYHYQSVDGLDTLQDRDCGLYASTDTSLIVLLGFPMCHLMPESARAIMEHAADLFGVYRAVAGDVNDDARLTIADLLRMIRILFLAEPLPSDMNWLDVNADCEFNIVDVQYLIAFMYLGGPTPQYGCASK